MAQASSSVHPFAKWIEVRAQPGRFLDVLRFLYVFLRLLYMYERIQLLSVNISIRNKLVVGVRNEISKENPAAHGPPGAKIYARGCR